MLDTSHHVETTTAENDCSLEIHPFRIAIDQVDLEDLQDRIARTHWPDELPAVGWSRGVPLDYLKELAEYWRSNYDWRAHEARLNGVPQFRTEIDGQTLHFLHMRSPEPDALPLIITHGYPSSVVEMLEFIGPLTDPRSHGGNPADAFHVVAPSIPGFGFSVPVSETGWDMPRVARAFAALMRGLGYERYGAHGSDIGAGVAGMLAGIEPTQVVGVHVTTDPTSFIILGTEIPIDPSGLSAAEREHVTRLQQHFQEGKGYLQLQSTRPLTLAYSLTDSPVGQLAWIVEPFKEWTDPAATVPEEAIDRDLLLTNVSLYWFTRTGASAANFLYESAHSVDWIAESDVPQGMAVFNADPILRRVLDPEHTLVHWSEFDRGGHFPAMEAPDLLVDDVRTFFRRFR
jgi:pimeloyl-ACP methyl ester carboxylesterase